MKAFREKFLGKWQEDFVKPFARELGLDLPAWAALARGQVTLAVTQDGWQGDETRAMGFLLLLDAQDQSGQLRTNLANLQRKWRETGKVLRTEKIRDCEFSVVPVSTNDVPAAIRPFFPRTLDFHEAGVEETAPKRQKYELVFGQADSLLIVGNSVRVVEQCLVRLRGAAMPTLAEAAGYEAVHRAQFKESPLFAWANIKTWFDLSTRKATAQKVPEPPAPVDVVKPEKLIAASGLGGISTLALSTKRSPEGLLLQITAHLPETSRMGLLKLFSSDAREWAPPPFVAADTVNFQRWRLDGKKTFATVANVLTEIAPQSLNGLNLIVNTAHDAAKLKDPAFDLKQVFAESLGDDLVQVEKPSAPATPGEGPSLLLLGSASPEKLAAALKAIFVIFPEPPVAREFLGRQILSMPLPPMPFLTGDLPAGPPRTLHFAAGSSYVALSTDSGFLEEYLRSGETKIKPLREVSGFNEAAQQVVGPGTTLFGYVNHAETIRAEVEQMRNQPGSVTNAPAGVVGAIANVAGLTTPERSWQEWMDVSLLPPTDTITRHFNFYVYALSVSAEGLTYKWFLPNSAPKNP